MKCKYCGHEIVGRTRRAKYCSEKCSREADKANKRKRALERGAHGEKQCKVCRNTFIPRTSRDKFCSNSCRWKSYNHQEENKQRRRDLAKKHRRRYEGIVIDSDISLFKLSKKNNNQCQICGMLVSWDDSPQGDMYPSIDHIKPISLGGLHSWDNVQLAHRRCNYMKSNKYIG